MIFKLTFPDKTLFAQAKNLTQLHVEYNKEYDDHEYLEMTETISEEEAKEIMLKNIDESTFGECPQISLLDTVCGDDFVVVGSTEWD
jgi:hypothetical protein